MKTYKNNGLDNAEIIFPFSFFILLLSIGAQLCSFTNWSIHFETVSALNSSVFTIYISFLPRSVYIYILSATSVSSSLVLEYRREPKTKEIFSVLSRILYMSIKNMSNQVFSEPILFSIFKSSSPSIRKTVFLSCEISSKNWINSSSPSWRISNKSIASKASTVSPYLLYL